MATRCLRTTLAAAALWYAPVASATSLVALDEEDLSHIADVIVVGEVKAVEVKVEAVFAPRPGKRVTTENTVEVAEVWKGPVSAGDRLPVTEFGGWTPDVTMEVEGTPGFLVGERVLLFLMYRASTNDFVVLGMHQGKYTLLPNGAGGWRLARVRVPLPERGKVFDASRYLPAPARPGNDFATFAATVKGIVAGDAKAGVHWTQMPKYRELSR